MAAATEGLSKTPWVVPDPNPDDQSQSTPAIVDGHMYFFAFADATHGALYESVLGAPGPGQATEIAREAPAAICAGFSERCYRKVAPVEDAAVAAGGVARGW